VKRETLLTYSKDSLVDLVLAQQAQTRLQQWNPERYGNGTIEDWKITVFWEPFEDFLIT
jgi:hypothetical protein